MIPWAVCAPKRALKLLPGLYLHPLSSLSRSSGWRWAALTMRCDRAEKYSPTLAFRNKNLFLMFFSLYLLCKLDTLRCLLFLKSPSNLYMKARTVQKSSRIKGSSSHASIISFISMILLQPSKSSQDHPKSSHQILVSKGHSSLLALANVMQLLYLSINFFTCKLKPFIRWGEGAAALPASWFHGTTECYKLEGTVKAHPVQSP